MKHMLLIYQNPATMEALSKEELAGDVAGARSSHRTAARRTTSLPERHYLEARIAGLRASAR